MTKILQMLKPGDLVEVIAPASRCSEDDLSTLRCLLTSWNLECIIEKDIFGDDLLCANNDENRFNLLKKALFRKETKAIICARGGYGSMRLIPNLLKLSPPQTPKFFIGMSDITALNLFFQQQWGWSCIHGALNSIKYSNASIQAVKAMLFGEVSTVEFNGVPMNAHAETDNIIEATMTGGNLCLIQSSIGSAWQMDARNKIVLLEEIGERGYRIDRMLEQLIQSKILDGALAIFIGDMIGGNEPNGDSKIEPVLERFAETCEIPVARFHGVGHGHTNFPVPLGTNVSLQLGSNIRCTCSTN